MTARIRPAVGMAGDAPVTGARDLHRRSENQSFLAVITLLAIALIACSAMNPTMCAAEHPRLLFHADDIPELRERARSDPWRRIKGVVERSTSQVYHRDGSYYQRLASMGRVMRQAALACILFPANRQAYVRHIVEQMRHWDDVNAARRQQPDSDWNSMITGGDAFFLSVIALDVIHHDLTESQLADIEARLRTWYEYERDQSRGSWYLAKYGAMGLWALYIDDHALFEEYATAYDRRLRQHFTTDGVALVGGNYASARLAGGELAKTYFMDVLTRAGWYDYYADPLLAEFYDWFYTGMVTPTRHYAVFQDCRDTRHSGTSGVIANYRAYRFSRAAAASAAWLQPGPLVPGILAYVLVDEPLPPARAPRSRLWWSGYAALWEEDPHEDSLMAALWAPNRAFSHDHFEVNALHLTGYGHTLVRNAGYEGWGNPAAGFSWNFVCRFDIRPEWDYAVSGNIAYLDRDRPHLSKMGGGLREGILHPALDYAVGHSGSAVNGGTHLRTLLMVKKGLTVKERGNGATPYIVLVDEMTRTESSAAAGTLRVALHPASLLHEIVEPRRTYRWAFDDDVFLTLFLATPAGEGTRLKEGGLSQFEAAPHYLHAEYELAGDRTQALTVLFPHQGLASCPVMKRIAGDRFSGVTLDHGGGLVDAVFESTTRVPVTWEGVRVTAKVALLRMKDASVTLYCVRLARHLEAPGAVGFDADHDVSLVMQGNAGTIVCEGANVTFLVGDRSPAVRIDGEPVEVVSRAPGRVVVQIPAGTHRIEIDEG